MVIGNNENNRSLFHHYLDGLYTTDGARRLLDELQASEYNTDMLQELMDEVQEEVPLQPPQTDPGRGQYKREARLLLKRIEHKGCTWFRRVSSAAASTAMVICLTLGSVSYVHYIDRQRITYLEASTSYGERKEIWLPDGTQLILNSCFRVCYPDRFTDRECRVELEGEGYLRVCYSEKQPLIASIRHFDVRVLGTCFSVKSHSPDEVVSVDAESDKVQVDLPEAIVRLRAKEQMLINTVSGGYDKQHEERTTIVWRRGSPRFNNTPIHDVAKKLECMYSCHIIFTQGQGPSNLTSGEHGNKSLEAVLQSAGYTGGIHHKGSGGQVLLYKQ